MTHLPTVLELTQQLVRQNTITGNEYRCAAILAEICEAAGFRIYEQEFAPGRKNLIAYLPSDRPALCFSGHLDTVPPGAAPWTHDPFAAEIADGKLYGRGSTDMKGGLAAMTIAAIQAIRRRPNPAGLVLLFTGGEESSSLGAKRLPELRPIIGEVGALVVAEPTSNYPVVGHKGALWLEALTTGKTAHGSMPDQGENAVYKAARAVVKLEDCELQGEAHPIMGKATLNVGTIAGGQNLNSVPDSARIEIDIRTTPAQDNATILQQISELLGEEVALSEIMNLAPIWTDPAHTWVQDVFAVTAEIAGVQPEPRSITYFTDAPFLAPILDSPPTLIIGPGEAVLAHQTDEYCRIDRLEQAVDLYEAMCRRWGHEC